MVVIVIRYKKISADVSWRILLLACVPQFDTMHPSWVWVQILTIGILLVCHGRSKVKVGYYKWEILLFFSCSSTYLKIHGLLGVDVF